MIALHDRRVPGTRANIDHIVVAPAGVFVVDAKHLTGMIRIRDKGSLFREDRRLYVGSRDHSALADGLAWQIVAVEASLMSAGVDPLPPITPVLCFIDGDWPWFRPPESFRGVRLERPRSLQKLVTAVDLLDEVAIERLSRILALALTPK